MPLARRAFLTAVASAAGTVACSHAPAHSDGTPAKEAPVTEAAAAAATRAARRLLPHHWRQLRFETTDTDTSTRTRTRTRTDTFGISGDTGRITITGNTAATQLTALRWYLKHIAHANISWAGEQLDLPADLPGLAAPVTRAANVPHRFALNDTNDGYTGAYNDWTYWERELDVLALHGYNEVLVYAGADALYHRVFRGFGYTDEELRQWIAGPAHQPWWLMQNLAAFPDPVSRQLLDARAALGRRIADRVRELGMTPVFPGYFGTVPPGFADRNKGARTVPQGTWMGLRRPDWLDPRTEQFARVAAAFYRAQDAMFGGPSTLYKMDLLHEGGDPGDVPVADAARASRRRCSPRTRTRSGSSSAGSATRRGRSSTPSTSPTCSSSTASPTASRR